MRSLSILLFLSFSIPLVYGYSCSSESSAVEIITDSIVTMEEGCTFKGSVGTEAYVHLNVSAMVQKARREGKEKVSVAIKNTSFTDVGLLINGYASGTMVGATVPLDIIIMNSQFTNTNSSVALYINGTMPPNSRITIFGNNIATHGRAPVATRSLVLTESRVRIENNIMKNYNNKFAMIWTESHTSITSHSSIEWVANTLNAVSCADKCECAVFSQTQTTLTVSGADSKLLWSGNTMECDSGQYSRIWYQHESKAIVADEAKIIWERNRMVAIAHIAEGYPYIWYMDSVTVSGKSNITFMNNELATRAPFYCRIWYQRGKLDVNGEESIVSWQNNNIRGNGRDKAVSGDLSLWFQGSNMMNTPTVTTVTARGRVQWVDNKIVMVGGMKGYVWRQMSKPTSTMNITERGAVLMVGNSISFTGVTMQALMWYQHSSVQSFSMSSNGTLAWWNNTMSFVNGAETTCVSCLSPSNVVLSDSLLAFEHNIVTLATTVNKDMALFDGPFVMKKLAVKINRNDFTFTGSHLALLWNATLRPSETTDCNLTLCRNKYNMIYMKQLPTLVAPSSLVPFVDLDCPYTNTTSLTATHAFTSSASHKAVRTYTSTAAQTQTKTLPHTPTGKVYSPTRTHSPSIATTTTTATAVDPQQVGNRAGEVPAAAHQEDSKALCLWCIIIPIVLGLLLCCCCLIIIFCCCRRKGEKKVLDDVEMNNYNNTFHGEANGGSCGVVHIDSNNIAGISNFDDPRPNQQDKGTIVIVVKNPFEVPKSPACEERAEVYSDSD